jgi:hypothetical protein
VLVVQLAHSALAVAVALVRQQPDDELGAHRRRRPEIAVLRVPQLAQERPPVAVAGVDAHGKADDG